MSAAETTATIGQFLRYISLTSASDSFRTLEAEVRRIFILGFLNAHALMSLMVALYI